mmetsp:Transcript_39274/g.98988  ORF Transcript_39274/g.98988 Transcript_39274/m.98988 type:complete len:289 (+) Transcript_39274:562-1428(+)
MHHERPQTSCPAVHLQRLLGLQESFVGVTRTSLQEDALQKHLPVLCGLLACLLQDAACTLQIACIFLQARALQKYSRTHLARHLAQTSFQQRACHILLAKVQLSTSTCYPHLPEQIRRTHLDGTHIEATSLSGVARTFLHLGSFKVDLPDELTTDLPDGTLHDLASLVEIAVGRDLFVEAQSAEPQRTVARILRQAFFDHIHRTLVLFTTTLESKRFLEHGPVPGHVFDEVLEHLARDLIVASTCLEQRSFENRTPRSLHWHTSKSSQQCTGPGQLSRVFVVFEGFDQ